MRSLNFTIIAWIALSAGQSYASELPVVAARRFDDWTNGSGPIAKTLIEQFTGQNLSNADIRPIAFCAAYDERPMVVEHCLVFASVEVSGARSSFLVFLSRNPYAYSAGDWHGEVDAGHSFDGTPRPSDVVESTQKQKVWALWEERMLQVIDHNGMTQIVEVRRPERLSSSKREKSSGTDN